MTILQFFCFVFIFRPLVVYSGTFPVWASHHSGWASATLALMWPCHWCMVEYMWIPKLVTSIKKIFWGSHITWIPVN